MAAMAGAVQTGDRIEDVASRRFWPVVIAFVLLGLALRAAAARGGLWLDEAWSAVYARDVGTPLGVFVAINHDNNHHLNTLWLQLVGWGAPPLAQRALSIACGTATIVLAALFARRRSPTAGIVAALLFAISPILVTYGSEARGYAPMVLALLGLLLIVDRWAEEPARPVPVIPLALVTLAGMLSQLTFLFGLAAISGWVASMLVFPSQDRQPLQRLAPAVIGAMLIPAAAVLLTVYFAGQADSGFAFGHLEPFSFRSWGAGLRQLMDYSFGSLWLALPLILLRGTTPVRPWIFYALALIAFPLAVAALQLGNSGAARYYLPWTIAGLLLVADRIGHAVAIGGWRRAAAAVVLVPIVIASAMLDVQTIQNQRADPMVAIDAVRARAPGGATVLVDNPRASAVLDAAAASASYPLAVQTAKCPPARYLFSDLDGTDLAAAAPIRCHGRYREIARGQVTALSGTHWRLYERLP